MVQGNSYGYRGRWSNGRYHSTVPRKKIEWGMWESFIIHPKPYSIYSGEAIDTLGGSGITGVVEAEPFTSNILGPWAGSCYCNILSFRVCLGFRV